MTAVPAMLEGLVTPRPTAPGSGNFTPVGDAARRTSTPSEHTHIAVDQGVVPSYPRPGKFAVSKDAPNLGWYDVEALFQTRLKDLRVSALHVQVIVRENPVLHLSTQRVVDDRPFFVTASHVTMAPVAEKLAAASWRRWKWTAPESWLFGTGVRLDEADPSGLLFARVSESPLHCARALFRLLADDLNLPSPKHLRFSFEEHTQEDYLTLREYLESLQRDRDYLAARGFSAFIHAVAGACAACNRPLRDPVSLRRGIGPECWSRIQGMAGWNHTLWRADLPPWYWVGATHLRMWRQRMTTLSPACSM